MMTDYYDRNGIPITEEQAAELRARPDYLAIARTKVLDGQDTTRSYDVSTVWLGLDHRFGEGAPVIFETMVFPEGDAAEIDVRRYPTEALAREGHTATVVTLAAELGDPVVMDVS